MPFLAPLSLPRKIAFPDSGDWCRLSANICGPLATSSMQRACEELLTMKNIVVMNDEAHHCYREKVGSGEEEKLTAEDRQEAKENNEAARLWISGIEALKRKVGLRAVYDLSATPFFLRGSGYEEGTPNFIVLTH